MYIQTIETGDTDMTEAETTFVKRMLPHFLSGKTVEQAAAAVLDDDRRIASAVLDYSYSARGTGERASIRRDISDAVYRRLRAE